MWYRAINNKIITFRLVTGWAYVLLMIMVPPVMADNSTLVSESSSNPALQVAERSNPWILPDTQESNPEVQPEFQQSYDNDQRYSSAPQPVQNPDVQKQYRREQPAQNRDRARQYQPGHQWQPQTERFVSPEFLESLKQQQQRYQVMPENQQYRQPEPGRFMQIQPGTGSPGQGVYGYPLYGTGSANPLYDTPAVSPWSGGPDVLYRGESFPMVPNEALGGFPPMHVPSFGINKQKNRESEELIEVDEYKVFNPFTFLPNGGSR